MSMKKILAAVMSAGMILSFIPAAVMADAPEWREEDGGWRYYTSETEYVYGDWMQIGGSWYYFTDNGLALTDTWQFIEGKLYHFKSSGALEQNKWIKYESGVDFDRAWCNNVYEGKDFWRYVGSDGAVYTGWKKVGGEWYYFNTADDAKFIDTEYADAYFGAMRYGWFYEDDGADGSYYFFDDNGKYLKNAWRKFIYDGDVELWYYFGSDGLLCTGWKQINGAWYYFDKEEGYATEGVVPIYTTKGDLVVCEYYLFDEYGKMLTGWQKSDANMNHVEYWYYSGSNGKLLNAQWKNVGGKWYYFDGMCRMVSNMKNFEIGGKGYDFDSNGVCTNPEGRKITGWYLKHYRSSDEDITGWFYYDTNGKVCKGWKQIGGKWYYFDPEFGFLYTAQMFPTGFEYNGALYGINKDGQMLTGWWKDILAGNWHYSAPDGKMYCNKWLHSGGNWYYFEQYGDMIYGTSYEIDGLFYDFDENGVCLNPYSPYGILVPTPEG